jgi:hypothetical protein
MTLTAGSVDPRVPEGHPLRRHILYRIDRARWEEMSEQLVIRAAPCGSRISTFA